MDPRISDELDALRQDIRELSNVLTELMQLLLQDAKFDEATQGHLEQLKDNINMSD